MLSILIPTFNYNCFDLVNGLNEQALKANTEYEIIVMDDCSTIPPNANQKISNLSNCKYIQLKENVGRAKIRNLLAQVAKYKFLLFLDNDGGICSENFIQLYLNACCNENTIVCGGRIYQAEKPTSEFILHWLYGSKREAISSVERQKNANHSFMSNNFLISKSLFNKIKFNEYIRNYGHEDTLFGYELKVQNYTINHIDNPLNHLGLESANIFLQKTKDSIQNLTIISAIPQYKDIIFDIKILRFHQSLENYKLTEIYTFLYKTFSKYIEKNLTSKKPSLFLFDIYKLGQLCLAYKN